MKNAYRRRNVAAAILVCAASLLVLAREPARYGPWSDPVPLVNSASAEYFPSLSKDGLSLYFTVTTSSAGPDIYVSRRASVDENWGYPFNLGSPINTAPTDDPPAAGIDSGPILSVDGHLLFFASDRGGGFGGNDIYVSRRRDRDDDQGWGPPQNLGSGVNTASNESKPSLFEDEATGERVLYFDCYLGLLDYADQGPVPSMTTPKNGNDICESRHLPDQTFGPARLVAELSTEFADRAPSVRKDGLEIFFSSNRVGLATLDIWTSTRPTTSSPWSEPVNLGLPVNTAANDAGAAISFDGRTLLFQRPPAGAPQYDIWLTTREKLK